MLENTMLLVGVLIVALHCKAMVETFLEIKSDTPTYVSFCGGIKYLFTLGVCLIVGSQLTWGW